MTATITVHGGLTAQPELRYSQSGIAIASGTIASTDRYLDKQTNEWRDGKKLFLRWSAFKELAENIAGSQLDKGAQVAITGRLHTREYEDNTGQKRSSTELEVTDFSVSLKKATATVQRTGQRAPQADTWTAPAAPTQNAIGGASYGDDSPF